MFGGEHVDVNLLYLLLLIKIRHDGFRAKADRFVSMNISAGYRSLDFHSISMPLGLMRKGVPMGFF